MPSSYWQSQLEPFNRGIGNLAQGLIRAPMLRAEAGYMQSRMGEQQQLAQEAAARTGLINAQQNVIRTGDARVDGAQTATANYMAAQQAYKANPTPENQKALNDATTQFSGSLATFKNVKVGDLVTALGKTGALNEMMGQNPNFATAAGMQGQAASIANNQADNAERAARPLNITGALMTPTGQILATAPRNVPEGDVTVGDANTPPLSVLASGTPKPTPPAGALPPSVLAPAFKQLLANSEGGTNTDQAISQLQQYNTPASALPATGASAPASARTFTDKTGQTFIYTGNLADPSKDQNPNNWQVTK